MKNRLLVLGYVLVAISFTGCATVKRALPLNRSKVRTVFTTYSGLKAKITLADFDVKATKATGEVCSALREILLTALINSNRFNVVARQQAGADLLISVVVTDFEPQTSGGRGGLGGGGGVGSGRFGGLLGTTLNKAHMALEIRIVNASTSELVAAGSVQGQASDLPVALKNGALGDLSSLGGLSAYANTPMEKAIRVCITEAARFISGNIPANYYKYTEHGKT
jgi:curli biogenesis system outer membrane secretion channel CsgG